MKTTINTVAEKIKKLSKPILIGVSGFGGSGKSTFASTLGEKLHSPVIGVDAFFKNNTQKNYKFWNIIDFERLKKEIITPFLSGNQPIEYGEFNWEKNKKGKNITLKHNGVVIIEGVGLFRPDLLQYFTCTIWLDCPIEEAIKRGKKRDTEEYNHSQDELWDSIWEKNDLQCFESFSPKQNADFIIDHSKRGEMFIT